MNEKLEKELIQELDPEQLSESQQFLYYELGEEKFIDLCKKVGGNNLYIPRFSEIVKKPIYDRIIKEFDGSNLKKLTIKYEISKSTVYNLVKNMNK